VLLAVCQEFGIEDKVDPAIANLFAGGIGSTGSVCGAVAGAVMGIGLVKGRSGAWEDSMPNHALVQEFRRRYEDEMETISCAELTGLDLTTPEDTPPTEPTITEAWTQALDAPFSQVARYLAYVEDRSPFGTHQGVKGLEFPRVMVIADDVHTRFKGLASYETLFGVKPLGPTAQKKADNGEETTIERTRRLLYVTCTRAEESLALVLYSEAPDTIRRFLISNQWMAEDEVVIAAADGTYQDA